MPNLKSKKTLIILLLAIGVGTAIIWLSSNPQILTKDTTNQTAKQENTDGTVLDCSQKIAQDNSSQISQNTSDTESDCLFLGCGDFF